MFALTGYIQIDRYRFTRINAVKIESSTRMLSSTAEVVLPLSALLENRQRYTIDKIIKRGHAVAIHLGYNDKPSQVFTGFVTAIETQEHTAKIYCQDYTYLLRHALPNKSFKSATLREIISYCAGALPLSGTIPHVLIDDFIVRDINGLQAIQKLMDEFGFVAFVDSNNHLYCGLPYVYKGLIHKYDLGLNVVKSDLKFMEADDIKVRVKATSILKNNKRIEVETGDESGELRSLFFYGISSQQELKKLAMNEILRYKYTGYRGTITGFGWPKTMPGDLVIITDSRYPAREGTYYTESVTIEYGQGGFRRTIEPGLKL
jgi:hypothetical protein